MSTVARGRPRDAARDTDLLDVTGRLLADRGYDGFTVADVARAASASKATVYRRWPTKADLVVAAMLWVTRHARTLPDTGSLRGDLLGLVDQMTGFLARHQGLVASFLGRLHRDAELAAAFREQFVRQRVAEVGAVFDRAQARGEVPVDSDTALLRNLVPSVIFFEVTVLGELPSTDHLTLLIDRVVLPLAASPPPGAP